MMQSFNSVTRPFEGGTLTWIYLAKHAYSGLNFKHPFSLTAEALRNCGIPAFILHGQQKPVHAWV